VCIMQLDEGMDTGPVLLERSTEIGDHDTAGTLFERLAKIGAEALLEAIDLIAAGQARPRPQPAAGVTHAAMLTKADGAIDFARPAIEVAARIRGVDPWPGAQALLRGEVVKLFGARRPSQRNLTAAGQGVLAGGMTPGTVVAIDEAGLHVATADGAIAIAELQLAGRKRMKPLDLARGRAIAVGDVLERPEVNGGERA